MNYKQQQSAIDAAIENLVNVLNSINPNAQASMACEIGESIRLISNWSDAQWSVREQLRPIYTAVNEKGRRVRVTIPE